MKELQARELKPIELPQMPETPLISVLIANYNYARYLGEAIESALNQTYPHVEIVVCDDGSTDNSCEVIEAYVQRDTRLKLVRKRNGGVSSALNVAYQQSSGQIICLLDADDVLMPNKVEKILEAFKSDPKCGFVIHNVMQIDSQGELIKNTPMFSKLASGWVAPFALENAGHVDSLPPASALCFRREIADFIFPINEEIVRNVDALIGILAVFMTLVVPVPEVLNLYRIHGTNLTATSSFTANFYEKELNGSERRHKEFKQFLEKFYGAQVAKRLMDMQSSVGILHDRYLLARLKGAPKSESREAHRQLVTHPQFGGSWLQRRLLQWGEYLPNALFVALFHQVYGTSQLKRLVKLVFGGVFTARRASA